LPSEKREIFTPEWQLIWINLPPEKRESKLHIPDGSFWLESVSILNCVTRCWEHTTSVPIVLPGTGYLAIGENKKLSKGRAQW
jgi:hypothetical protein